MVALSFLAGIQRHIKGDAFSFTWTVKDTCITTIFGGEMNRCCSQTDQTGQEFSGYCFLPTCGDKLSAYCVKVYVS